MSTRAGLVIVMLLIVAVLLLGSCSARERFLTEEQDAKIAEVCAEHGCKVIPLPRWREIEEQLQRRAGAI